MTTRITLTQKQRESIDAGVLLAISEGHIRTQTITTRLDGWMLENLPRRKYRFRYIDAAIQRLAKANRIELVGGGHYGWKVTGK